MDKKSINLQSQQKQDKVGADGLTKKERRALKVQEKSTTTTQLLKKEESKIVSQKINEDKSESVKNAKLNEKELRKLEWEKKLAEKKILENTDKKDEISKAELKNVRRQQQENQRLAKKEKEFSSKPKVEKNGEKKEKKESEVVSKPKLIKKEQVVSKVQLVHHLYVENSTISTYENKLVNYKNVHPAFVRLGVQYSTKRILGSNARCLSLLLALKYLVQDLQTPPKQEFCRYLESVLQSCLDYLQYCRPFAVSMTNALRCFKLQLTQEATKLKDEEKKLYLLNVIETYVTDQVNKAGEAISLRVNEKISKKGDVILTFGCSSLIKQILFDAHNSGKEFEVIVVDGRPFLEGRQMLQRLVRTGIKCHYVQIHALSFVMSMTTKVLLGAHALLANGYVMARIGTAQVAMVARAYNKPVLVCCETHKFSERVQTDSFVYNEIGDNELLTQVDTMDEPSPLNELKCKNNPIILNLLYDVTPPDLVTAVVTELAILPCTSVPVVLRIKPTEMF